MKEVYIKDLLNNLINNDNYKGKEIYALDEDNNFHEVDEIYLISKK